VAFQANRAHARLDSCNECHLPNGDPVSHFIADGIVGTRDLVEFYLLGRAPYDTEATDWTKSVVEANCIRCHSKTVAHVDVSGRTCWDCHRIMHHRVQLEVVGKTPLGEDASR
jgi:cytochrome c nitrite reductase small subunit